MSQFWEKCIQVFTFQEKKERKERKRKTIIENVVFKIICIHGTLRCLFIRTEFTERNKYPM